MPSSKNLFLLGMSLFISLVVFKFISIKSMAITTNDSYIYQLPGDIYGEFYMEKGKTYLKNSSNIDIIDASKGKTKTKITPYSFVNFKIGSDIATYQLMPDKREATTTIFAPYLNFVLIGGDKRYTSKGKIKKGKRITYTLGKSIVRFNDKDRESLIILPLDSRSLLHSSKLAILAKKRGYKYITKDGSVDIPVFNGSNPLKIDKNQAIKIDKYGYIRDPSKAKKIRIYLGKKNRSIKQGNRYVLQKAKTINISIVDNKTPSSTLQLVNASKGLYQTKLSYDNVRISHLLLKYNINNALETINKKIVEKSNFIYKELTDIANDIDASDDYLIKHQEKISKLSDSDKTKLNNELMDAVTTGNYYATKNLIFMGADVNSKSNSDTNLLSIILSQQKEYLTIPEKMEFAKNEITNSRGKKEETRELIIKGKDKLFNISTLTDIYFPTSVPILDKPLIDNKNDLNIEKLNEFIEASNLNGLYIDDINAKVFYSKNPKTFTLEAISDYKKTPPLFIENPDITGKFVAPTTSIRDKFYFKIKTKRREIKIAFNGIIQIDGKKISKRYNSITPYNNIYTLKVPYSGELIIEVSLIKKFLECGVVFESKKKIPSLKYSYGGRYKPFEIINRGDRYLYKFQKDSIKLFKKYKFYVRAKRKNYIKYLQNNKSYKISNRATSFHNYSASISCLGENGDNKFLSLYNKNNMLDIIPDLYRDKGSKAKYTQKIDKNSSKPETNKNIFSKELLPIYGDGVSFGVLKKAKMDELTLDSDFSQKVAEIFESVIKPLKSNTHKARRAKYNTILEGAVVVLEDKGDNDLSVVSMFSYPYPKKIDISQPDNYKQEISKLLLINEFNNPKSPIRNRALDMRVHPGSTFKIVTSLAGFKTGKIKKLDNLKCGNKLCLEGTTTIKDLLFKQNTTIDIGLKNYTFASGATEKTHGATFESSFKFSYNVYFGYLSLMLNKTLDNGFKRDLLPINTSKKDQEKNFPLLGVANELQFNKPLYLSKERGIFAYPSVFPSPTTAKEVADAGIGQFEIEATPMQMAVVVNSIKNRNVVIPKIIKSEKAQVLKKNIISSQDRDRVQNAMNSVVENIDGTAKCAFFSNKFNKKARDRNRAIKKRKGKKTRRSDLVRSPCYGYQHKFKRVNKDDFNVPNVKVYGKTGTAQKGKGNLYDGWFVAYTKKESNSVKKSDIIVVTIVRNSGTGGTYSATITKKVMEAWYKRGNK